MRKFALVHRLQLGRHTPAPQTRFRRSPRPYLHRHHCRSLSEPPLGDSGSREAPQEPHPIFSGRSRRRPRHLSRQMRQLPRSNRERRRPRRQLLLPDPRKPSRPPSHEHPHRRRNFLPNQPRSKTHALFPKAPHGRAALATCPFHPLSVRLFLCDCKQVTPQNKNGPAIASPLSPWTLCLSVPFSFFSLPHYLFTSFLRLMPSPLSLATTPPPLQSRLAPPECRNPSSTPLSPTC